MASTPEKTAATMRSDHQRWRNIISAAAIRTN
jgi:hypothetical protein